MKLPNDEGELAEMMNTLNEFTNNILPHQIGAKQAAHDMQKENEDMKKRQLQAIAEAAQMWKESHEATLHEAEQEERMYKLEVEQALRPPPGQEENFAPMKFYKQHSAYEKVDTDDCNDGFDAELPAKTRPHTKDFGVRKMDTLIQRFDNVWSRRRRIAILVAIFLLMFGFSYFGEFSLDDLSGMIPAPASVLNSRETRVLRD
jgi:phenylalanyl-tRNA synthetase alpha subunit